MGVYIKGITIEQLRRMGVAGIILSEDRLVEVKEPHGRLIDENEVRVIMGNVCIQHQRPTWNDVYNGIRNMNAVIEAEKDETSVKHS